MFALALLAIGSGGLAAEDVSSAGVDLRPYLAVDGRKIEPGGVTLTRDGSRLVATLVAPSDGVYTFGIAIERDSIAPLAPGMPALTGVDLQTPRNYLYPYDWAWHKQGNVLSRRPRLVMPGVRAGGKLYVVDTCELLAIRFERTERGPIRALLLKHRVHNDGGDVATPDLPLRAGDREEFVVNVFDSLEAANTARFGKASSMTGRMTQPAYRGWTQKSLSRDDYRKIADRLKGVYDYAIIREVEVHDWIPPLFHERGMNVFAYQYLGALRRTSSQLTAELEAQLGLTDANGRPYTAPTSPNGAWLLCDIRRDDVRKRFVDNARAAVDAGFDGIFLDGYPFWADATGRIGGNAPGATQSLAHARWQLLYETKQALRAADPNAKLGVLGNQYCDFLGEADFVVKERMYFAWDSFAKQFDQRRTKIRQDLDVPFEEEQAPFVAGSLAHGVKGYSPLSVQSCLHFLRKPTGLLYLGMGDFFPDRLDDWLHAVTAIATEDELRVEEIEPPTAYVHFGGLSTMWADTDCTVTFSQPTSVRTPGDERLPASRSLALKRGERYEILHSEPRP